MNFDRTFCLNKTCPLKDKCDRHYSRVDEFIKENPDKFIRPLSVSEFGTEKDKECQYFSKKEEKYKK
jgi:hypothetical protein